MALANSLRRLSSAKADGLATIAFTSSSKRVLSPPLRMNLLTKSVARRVASPSGIPRRIKSLVFITSFFLLSLPPRLQSISSASCWRLPFLSRQERRRRLTIEAAILETAFRNAGTSFLPSFTSSLPCTLVPSTRFQTGIPSAFARGS